MVVRPSWTTLSCTMAFQTSLPHRFWMTTLAKLAPVPHADCYCCFFFILSKLIVFLLPRRLIVSFSFCCSWLHRRRIFAVACSLTGYYFFFSTGLLFILLLFVVVCGHHIEFFLLFFAQVDCSLCFFAKHCNNVTVGHCTGKLLFFFFFYSHPGGGGSLFFFFPDFFILHWPPHRLIVGFEKLSKEKVNFLMMALASWKSPSSWALQWCGPQLHK